MNLITRFRQPTPLFFQRIARWGTLLIALSALASAPELMNIGPVPPIFLKLASYLFTAGTIMNLVSRAAVDGEG